MDLKIEVQNCEDRVHVTLTGDLTSESAPSLREIATDLEETHASDLPVLVLSFLDITYIDSAGLGTLVFLHKAWQGRGKPMVILRLSPLAKKFLRTTGLLRVFHVVETEDDLPAAIERFERELESTEG